MKHKSFLRCVPHTHSDLRKLRILRLLIVLVMQGVFSFAIAQTIVISGTNTLEVGVNSTFSATASNNYFTNVSKYAYTVTVGGITVYSIEHSSTKFTDNVTFSIDRQYAPSDFVKIDVKVIGKDNYGNVIDGYATKENIRLNGIGTLKLMAPFSAQKCCTGNLGFSLSGYEDGNIFNWTYPAGWTVVSGGGTDQITLKPDTQTGGTISCEVKRAEASPNYSKR